MSIKLLLVLLGLMVANQIVGTSYGSFIAGFSGEKLKYGLWKLVTAAVGYGAIALAAHFANDYINGMEYLSGILLEPIARYFLDVVDKLKKLVNSNITDVIAEKATSKNDSQDNNK